MRTAHEIVVDDDFRHIFACQQVHGMRTDQTGAADDHNLFAF